MHAAFQDTRNILKNELACAVQDELDLLLEETDMQLDAGNMNSDQLDTDPSQLNYEEEEDTEFNPHCGVAAEDDLALNPAPDEYLSPCNNNTNPSDLLSFRELRNLAIEPTSTFGQKLNFE